MLFVYINSAFRYSVEHSAALAYDKMAIVLLGERARTNYDRTLVAQLLQEPQEEVSGDGVVGWEASSEDAVPKAGSDVAGSDPEARGGVHERSTAEGTSSLVDATTTRYEQQGHLGGLVHNVLAMACKDPPLDGLMYQLGQRLAPTSAVRVVVLVTVWHHVHRACRRAWR